jgi:hypothetical protein
VKHPTSEAAPDYAAIHALALDNLQDVLDLRHRNGRPCGALAGLNPGSERCIKHLHVINHPVWRWVNLNGPGQGYDTISLIEFLADVDRDTAAVFLRDHIERCAANRRPAETAA